MAMNESKVDFPGVAEALEKIAYEEAKEMGIERVIKNPTIITSLDNLGFNFEGTKREMKLYEPGERNPEDVYILTEKEGLPDLGLTIRGLNDRVFLIISSKSYEQSFHFDSGHPVTKDQIIPLVQQYLKNHGYMK